MEKVNLGELLPTNAQTEKKDAFHTPCVVVTSKFDLLPGQSVHFGYSAPEIKDKDEEENDYDEEEHPEFGHVYPCDSNIREAIVDPFLKEPIPKYSRFWVLVEPTLVSSLSHSFQIKGYERQIFELNETQAGNIECALQGC